MTQISRIDLLEICVICEICGWFLYENEDSATSLWAGRKLQPCPREDLIRVGQAVHGHDLPDPLIPFGVGNAGAVTLHQLHQRIARLAQARYHLTNDGTMKGKVG
jgi:hypothetical protein